MHKYNIQRIKHLIAMLKENRYPNFQSFLKEMKKHDTAGTYKLSNRTFLRDIAFLKSEYNAPIEYDHTNKGYYLTLPDWSVDIPFLYDNEMQSAVLGARLAENIMPPPVKQKIRSAVNSLLTVNEKGLNEYTQLLSLVALGSKIVIDPQVFDTVFQAWQNQMCLQIVYEQVIGNVSKRIIEPHALVFYEGNWYIKAVIDDTNKNRSVRTYALHRFKSAKIYNKSFTPDQEIIESVNRREIFDFPMVEDIQLRLSVGAYKFIGEQFDIAEERKDGKFYFVKIPAAPEYKIVNYILAEAGEAKLLNHPKLVKEVINRADKVKKLYKN